MFSRFTKLLLIKRVLSWWTLVAFACQTPSLRTIKFARQTPVVRKLLSPVFHDIESPKSGHIWIEIFILTIPWYFYIFYANLKLRLSVIPRHHSIIIKINYNDFKLFCSIHYLRTQILIINPHFSIMLV